MDYYLCIHLDGGERNAMCAIREKRHALSLIEEREKGCALSERGERKRYALSSVRSTLIV